MQEFVLYYGIGVLAWLIAFAMPLRQFEARAPVGLDLLAAFCTLVFAVGADWALGSFIVGAVEHLQYWHQRVAQVPWWVLAPGYVVLADFGAYWSHRLLHTGWLWHTHAWHHSPAHLYWLAGLRASPVHVLLLSAPYAFAFVLLPGTEAAIAGLTVFCLDAANQHMIHSNLRLPYARKLEYIFVTPRYHFVHHSDRREVSDSNYGFLFSIWDRWFGTFTDPDTIPADGRLGLNYEIGNLRLVLGLPAPKQAAMQHSEDLR